MNRTTVIENFEASQLKNPSDVPDMRVGDTVDIHYRIIEGDKERVQRFQGVIISLKGRGINRMMTVRRIVANEGVERIFPVHSPRVGKIDVLRRADVRRAKLYFLRGRTGKSRRLREDRDEAPAAKS